MRYEWQAVNVCMHGTRIFLSTCFCSASFVFVSFERNLLLLLDSLARLWFFSTWIRFGRNAR